jgi:hypothetical protein
VAVDIDACARRIGSSNSTANIHNRNTRSAYGPAGNYAAETALLAWPYRIRTSMCGEKIHPFEPTAMSGI